MTASIILDFNADATDRLAALMEVQNVSTRDRLKQSTASAAAQLEWFKPEAMGDGKRGGLYAGPVIMAKPGTAIIVLAHHKRVFAISLLPAVGTIGDAVEAAVGYVEIAMGSEAVEPRQTLLSVEEMIRQHGHLPGKRGPELTDEHNMRLVGILFAAIPATGRAGIVRMLDKAIAEGVCPAMIGLIGKGSEQGFCGVWPLLLPLAPYADAVLA
jgi:hypothetical protein